MTHLQKLKATKDIETEHEVQKELLLEQITKINTLYSECNGIFLKELSVFVEEYAKNNNIDFLKLQLSKHPISKEHENRRQIKLGQLYDEISPKLATKNKENNRISPIISNISRTQEAI